MYIILSFSNTCIACVWPAHDVFSWQSSQGNFSVNIQKSGMVIVGSFQEKFLGILSNSLFLSSHKISGLTAFERDSCHTRLLAFKKNNYKQLIGLRKPIQKPKSHCNAQSP